MHVNYVFLRLENPKCERGHDLGLWVHCEDAAEKHVYLRSNKIDRCPYCQSREYETVKEGVLVKCLHVGEEGKRCIARPFSWMKEGPPCFLNHVDKMRLEVRVLA
jgi:hypothetical protein